MADTTADKADTPQPRGLLRMALLSLVLAAVAAAGGYAAVLFDAFDPDGGTEKGGDGYAVAFVPLDPIVVSLGSGPSMGHLTFSAQVETSPEWRAEVEAIAPRLVSTINAYLRAVDPEMLQGPSALFVVRSQLLRRIKVVAGEKAVRDLLVMEFVIS